MPDLFEIQSSSGAYPIEVGVGLVKRVVDLYPQAIFVIDSKLVSVLPESVKNKVVIEAVETNKALEKTAEYVTTLRELGANRDTHIVAVGGGIIQDVATFIASIYMRGVSWTYLPTTVLSMVDSCIGGKSSVNVFGYKNLVGNFYPPRDIFIDPAFIYTLDDDMVVGGLFEAAKICYAKGLNVFSEYVSLNPSVGSTHLAMQKAIGLSLLTKKWFIEIDEFDQKERLLLNFGHTFGHAIEASTNFEVHHGIGVGVGMLVACEYACNNLSLTESGYQSIDKLRYYVEGMLLSKDGSSVGSPSLVDIDLTLEKFDYDKKHKTNAYRIVAPVNNGELSLVSIARDNQEKKKISDAYAEAFKSVGWSYH